MFTKRFLFQNTFSKISGFNLV